jgi:hypothetical protein
MIAICKLLVYSLLSPSSHNLCLRTFIPSFATAHHHLILTRLQSRRLHRLFAAMQIDDRHTKLDLIGQEVWTSNLQATDLQKLKEKATRFARELEVLEVFANTLEWLRSADSVEKGSKRSAAHRGRVQKMMKEAHNTGTDPTSERLARLHDMDMKTFLFIAASYTPLGIKRLDQNVFDCVVKLAPQYVQSWAQPGWLHRTEFQLAVTASAGKGSEFKRSMYCFPMH